MLLAIINTGWDQTCIMRKIRNAQESRSHSHRMDILCSITGRKRIIPESKQKGLEASDL